MELMVFVIFALYIGSYAKSISSSLKMLTAIEVAKLTKEQIEYVVEYMDESPEDKEKDEE